MLDCADSPVGLEGDFVVASDLAEVSLELLEQLIVAKRLVEGHERVNVCEVLQTAWHHLGRAVQLHRAGTLFQMHLSHFS
jgi:hypothetical protein